MSRSKSNHAAWVAYKKGQPVSDEELNKVKEDLETVIRVLAELDDGQGIATRFINSKLDQVNHLIYIRTQK